MSYRPICDTWILARTKLKKDEDGEKQSYYGAFPAGFLHRARQLLGVRRTDPVLHVCGGMVKQCLYRGFEENDRTADLDPGTAPDYLMDVRRLGIGKGDLFPHRDGRILSDGALPGVDVPDLWPAMIIDRPYTAADHAEYNVERDAFPRDLNDLLKRALQCVEPGGRVGVLDYLWPHPGKWGKEVATIAVGTGRNNRARWFTVFERLAATSDDPKEPAPEDDDEAKAVPARPSPQTEEPTPPSPPAPSAPSRRRRPPQASAAVETFVCARCDVPGFRKGQTIVGADDVRRCGDCHRAIAGGLIPAVKTVKMCKACSGTGKTSAGGFCVCTKRMTAKEREAFFAAVRANVCHGCKEGLLLEGVGKTIEPLTDKPNKWHGACWEQKLVRDGAAARKKRDDQGRAEARAKGWIICATCARAITPSQRSEGGRHYACAAPKPRRRATRPITEEEMAQVKAGRVLPPPPAGSEFDL